MPKECFPFLHSIPSASFADNKGACNLNKWIPDFKVFIKNFNLLLSVQETWSKSCFVALTRRKGTIRFGILFPSIITNPINNSSLFLYHVTKNFIFVFQFQKFGEFQWQQQWEVTHGKPIWLWQWCSYSMVVTMLLPK